jgi:hypothetical protein
MPAVKASNREATFNLEHVCIRDLQWRWCADDPESYQRLEELLRGHEQAGGFLSHPLKAAAARATEETGGVVYLAEQQGSE